MSDRMTSIILPSGAGGISDRGTRTVAEMIAEYREYAAQNLTSAQAILAATDEDFRVITYTGVYAMRDLTVLQEGRAEPPQ